MPAAATLPVTPGELFFVEVWADAPVIAMVRDAGCALPDPDGWEPATVVARDAEAGSWIVSLDAGQTARCFGRERELLVYAVSEHGRAECVLHGALDVQAGEGA